MAGVHHYPTLDLITQISGPLSEHPILQNQVRFSGARWTVSIRRSISAGFSIKS